MLYAFLRKDQMVGTNIVETRMMDWCVHLLVGIQVVACRQ